MSGQLLQQSSVLSERIRIKEFLSALDVAASLMDARNYSSKSSKNEIQQVQTRRLFIFRRDGEITVHS